jgi:hypothetical protein
MNPATLPRNRGSGVCACSSMRASRWRQSVTRPRCWLVRTLSAGGARPPIHRSRWIPPTREPTGSTLPWWSTAGSRQAEIPMTLTPSMRRYWRNSRRGPNLEPDVGPCGTRAEFHLALMASQGSAGNVIAALASFFIPGLGQLLQGRLIKAVLMFVLAAVLWWFLLGWLVHLWSILDAALFKRPAS